MSLLADLAGELGLDESVLRSSLLSGEAEALQPTYLTTDATGAVNANFSGHVHAQGLDLDAAENPTGDPGQLHKVQWTRAADGSLVADIFGSHYDNGSGDTENTLYMEATDAATGTVASITNAAYNSGLAFVQVDCGASHAQIIDSDGNSSFLKLAVGGNVALEFDSFNIGAGWAQGSKLGTALLSRNYTGGIFPFITYYDYVNQTAAFCWARNIQQNSFDIWGWNASGVSGAAVIEWAALCVP